MTMKTTMKAVRIHSFGGPEVLRLEDAPIPQPGSGEVLVRIHTAGVNPVDWKIREGRLGKIPFPSVAGSDFSGVIDALGAGVADFRVGEPIFGTVGENSGSYAEFAVAPVSRIARRAASLDDARAAGLPVAASTAWQALFDAANLQAGQRLLVHGAAGGVGGFAVQFAKWKGAHVIGTASAANLGYVRELGAEEVINYQSARFEDVVRGVDVVLDTIGGETQERSLKVLKPGGVLVSTVNPPDKQKAAALGVRATFMILQSRGDRLARIADLVASGEVKVHVEVKVPLAEARKAQELSQGGHVRGKIVLVVDSAVS
jgi:NADPH:quinone reductase-like Zn-dependent oxidoreductase